MYLRKHTKILFALTVTSTLSALGQEALTIPPGSSRVQTFGMVGITTGQDLRLNVLNAGILTPTEQPISCGVQFFFVSDQGVVLKRAAATIGPGRSHSVDISRDADIAAGQSRVEVRAVVTSLSFSAITPGSAPRQRFCQLVPTLELFDRDTGRTTVILAHPTNFISLPGIIGGGLPLN
jgi:hypothetical protein